MYRWMTYRKMIMKEESGKIMELLLEKRETFFPPAS